MGDERRRFERINIPESARIYVRDANGKRLGVLRILGRGGMLFSCETPYESGSKATFQIVDDAEGITRPVNTIVRYFTPEGIACEFERLDTDAAVDIGVWIGKFCSFNR